MQNLNSGICLEKVTFSLATLCSPSARNLDRSQRPDAEENIQVAWGHIWLPGMSMSLTTMGKLWKEFSYLNTSFEKDPVSYLPASCGHLKFPWVSQTFLDISFQENEYIPSWVFYVEWDGLNSRCHWFICSDFGGNSGTKLTWEQLCLCVTIWRESQPLLPPRRWIRRMVRRIQII